MAHSHQLPVIIQATGNVGRAILKALVDDNGFNVTVLSRRDGVTFPEGVVVKVVDLYSVESLIPEVKGHQAVIDATSGLDPSISINLMTAAREAGVYRFIPSEFGLDPANAKVQALPVFHRKAVCFRNVQQEAERGGLTWTIVATGPFLDWNLKYAITSINVFDKKICLFDDGEHVMPWTTLESVGKATVSVLRHLEETENRTVFVSSIETSIKDLAQLAKEAIGADGWETSSRNNKEAFDKAMSDYAQGLRKKEMFEDMIRYTASSPEYSGPWAQNDNELLGVKQMNDQEVKELIVAIVAEGKDAKKEVQK